MESIRYVPFFRLIVPLILGICLALSVHSSLEAYWWLAAILLVLVLATVKISGRWSLRWVFGVLTFLFWVTAGFVLTANSHKEGTLTEGKEADAIVTLISPPEPRANTYRAIGRVESIKDAGSWKHPNEKVMLYFRSNDSSVVTLNYGSVIVIRTAFSAPPSAANPHQFDYAKYLAKRGILYTAFVSPEHWHAAGSKKSRVMQLSYTLRDSLMVLFERIGLEGNNLAVASALTMGYKNLLDEKTRRAFAASGAMHILAVSGLHVGILFVIVSSLLSFLRKVPKGRLIQAALIISFLWFYALFTGLSPSVMRASLMFSFIVVGRAVYRKTNIYNSICASAFILLIVNPMLLLEVGFQLSYLAVISIVFFYPYIYKLAYFPNKLVDKAWSLIAVSIAAQIGTFSLGLFYFNQFPIYFLLTNLYAIPLAFVIIHLTIALIMLSPIWLVGEWVGKALELTLSALNWLTTQTEALPGSTVSGIAIPYPQLILLILFVALLGAFLERRKGLLVTLALGSLSLLFAHRVWVGNTIRSQSEVVIFATRGATNIGFRNGNHFILSHNDTTSACPLSKYSFSTQGYINYMNVKHKTQALRLGKPEANVPPWLTTYSTPIGEWLIFSNRQVFIPSGNQIENYKSKENFTVDVMLITSEIQSIPKQLLATITPKIIVIDESVPSYLATRMKILLKGSKLKVHDVRTNGAFILPT